MPLDQALPKTSPAAQTCFDTSHPACVSLVIITKKMQQTVQSQHTKLGLQRMARLPSLPARDACRNHDVAEATRFI